MALFRCGTPSAGDIFLEANTYVKIAGTITTASYTDGTPVDYSAGITAIGGSIVVNTKGKTNFDASSNNSGGAVCVAFKNGIGTALTVPTTTLDADYVIVSSYGALSSATFTVS